MRCHGHIWDQGLFVMTMDYLRGRETYLLGRLVGITSRRFAADATLEKQTTRNGTITVYHPRLGKTSNSNPIPG